VNQLYPHGSMWRDADTVEPPPPLLPVTFAAAIERVDALWPAAAITCLKMTSEGCTIGYRSRDGKDHYFTGSSWETCIANAGAGIEAPQ
jgi:hypothetical protein